MRKLLKFFPILALLLCALPARAADCSNNLLGSQWICIQSKGQVSGSGSINNATLAYTSNVGNMHLLVVDASWYNVGTTVSATDTLSTTFSCTNNAFATVGGNICYGCTTSSGADTVTFTFGSTVTYAHEHVFEFSGGLCPGPFDVGGLETGGTATAITTNDITTSQDTELLVVCGGSFSLGDPWVAGTDTTGGAGTYTLYSYSFAAASDAGGCELLVAASAGAHNGVITMAGSTAWVGNIVAFKQAPIVTLGSKAAGPGKSAGPGKVD